jgi:Ca-activated chloride channel family protein
MNLSFDNPEAFWLLLLLPVFVVLKVLADARARRAVTRLASPRLLDGLLVSEGRGRNWVVFSLELAAMTLFVSALARPQYGTVSEELKSSGRSLIVAIDASKSMLADDVKPNRLERAQFAAQDLVKQLHKDRIGLMQFAGTANMLAPFTEDTDAVQEIIESIDTDGVALGGSNLSNAIEYGIDVFHKAELSGQQAMVIFSDGEELQGQAIEAARKAKEAKIAIICVAVGTEAGAIIPSPDVPGDYFRDKNNKPVLTKLHKEVLERIADITGGLYLRLDGQGVNDSRIDLILRKLHRSDMKSKTIETKVDRYRWPLSAGLLSLLAAFLTGILRRHRVAIPQGAVAATTAVGMLFLAFAFPVSGQEIPPPSNVNKDKKPEAAKTEAEEKPAEDPPKEGDPWQFYREGDWKNSVFNFRRTVGKLHTDREIDRYQMGCGVAAFKAALDDPKKFDGGMIETAIESFGQALVSSDPAVREAAHYNLANSIYERTRAAEAARDAAFNTTKKKKEKKKYRLTLKYLDGVIRQLENSMEHYQETLTLNSQNKDAQKNLDKVTALVKELRNIREEKAKNGQGESEGKSQGKSQGKGQGKGKGKGQGQGQGNGQGKGQGAGSGDEEDDDGGGDEDEDDGDGDNGDKPGDGSGDEDGDKGKGGKGEGEEEGKGKGDESNKEFDGKLKADGDAGNHDGDKGDKEKGGKAGGPESGSGEVARQNTIQKLKNLSQELPPRERTKSVPETRPAKDW